MAITTATKNKLVWADWSKTICILSIVLVHILLIVPVKGGLGEIKYVLSYFIPIFFALPGYFQKPIPVNQYKNYFIRNAKALLIPYVGYYIINYFAWLVGYLLFTKNEITFHEIIIKPFLGLVIGNGADIEGVSYAVSPPLWFLISLFTCRILTLFFIKFTNSGLTVLYALLFIVLGYILDKNIENQYLSVISTIQCFPFLIFGFLLKKHVSFNKINKTFYLPLALLALILIYVLVFFNEYGLNSNDRNYGNYYFSLYIGGILGILCSIFLGLSLSKYNPKFNQFFSANTLIVMGMHGIVIRILALVIVFINPNWINPHSTLSSFPLFFISLIVFIATVLLLIPIIKFITAKLPWLAGRA